MCIRDRYQRRVRGSITTDEDGLLVFTDHHPDDLIFHTVVNSPFAQKVHMYLLYKQIPFTIKYVHPKRLVKYAVPMLQLKDGTFLSESSELGIWLEDNFPDTPSILPIHIRQQQIELEARLSKLLIGPIFQLSRPHVPSGSPWVKFTSMCTQIRNCWRMGWCMEGTIPGGVGILKYIWPLIMRKAAFAKVIVDDVYARTNGKSATQNMSDALDVFEAELRLAEDEFYNGNNQVEGVPPQRRDGDAESDVVLLSRSLSRPGMADLTAYATITTAHRLGINGADGYRSRPAVMWWVKKMDSIMAVSYTHLTLPTKRIV
eukprot:TRINITY_DN9107_c0_g1_i4.p1 TRINITY_DN9107_c0_g1~~TRINITY_DN9107_c0_g1_i4.p1  ORF type:complete len:316 (-),score=65.27 TRINITY_DN9107_c0_g1_i4:93-1040(-)